MKTPPAADVVAARLRCLYATLLRGHADYASKNHDSGIRVPTKASATQLHAMCLEALENPQLSPHFTRTERSLIKRKLGGLKVYEARYCLYRAAGLNVLAWAIRGFDCPADPERLIYAVQKPAFTPSAVLGPSLLPWLKKPKLHPADKLKKRFLLEQAWAWRVRVEIIKLTGFVESPRSKPDAVEDFLQKQIATRAAECQALGLFKARQGDFPSGRSTYGKTADLCFSERLEKVMDEKVRAASWMLDPHSSWDAASAASPPGFEVPRECRGPGYSTFMKHHFNPSNDLDSYRFPR